MFDNEEVDGITMDLKQAATESDIPDTRQAVYNFFITRVRQNLHVVLALSPAGMFFSVTHFYKTTIGRGMIHVHLMIFFECTF